MQDLTISLVQTNLYWQDAQANLGMLEEKIWNLSGKTDLIILPEMFTTGFSMDAPVLAEPMNLTTFKWMKQMAGQTGAVITGSYIVNVNGDFFNRLIWMRPDGSYSHYDKRHLFRMADEHKVYTAGNKRIICDIKGWKIAPFICYDLRFPVWTRNSKAEMFDLMLFVANWPEKRAHMWNTLLQARAIENLSYVIGVNRVGEDGKQIHYSGDSAIINPKGETIYHLHETEAIHTELLSYEMLYKYRKSFPAYLDADNFEII
jgi:predicted amidohydrolase